MTDARGHRFFSVLETYSGLYSFTLLWHIGAVALLANFPSYSYSPAYIALMTVAPFLGMTSLLLASPRDRSVGGTIRHALLLAVIAALGSLAIIFLWSLLIVPTIGVMEQVGFGAASEGLAVVMALIAAPIVVSLVRTVLFAREAGWAVRSAAMLLAVVAIAAAIVFSVTPGNPLAHVLRKDQITAIFGALSWFLPAYGVAGAVVRAFDVEKAAEPATAA